jgi:hypothetical protein
MLQSTPAIHQHKKRKDGIPDRVAPNRQPNECSNPQEAQTGGNHQTSGSPHEEPEQRPQNLSTVKRIDRQHVEHEQYNIEE